MEKGLTPLYLTHLISLRVGDTTNYPLRNSDDYVAINAKTRSYANSFLPSTIIAWNNLPNSVKSATTVASFKHMLAQSKPIIPDYYYNDERKLEILHTRLRTECSSLNEHLFRRNLAPSPNCICGEIENNGHFLLSCARYSLIRQDMLNSFQSIIPQTIPISTDLLLCGNQENLSIEEKQFRICWSSKIHK